MSNYESILKNTSVYHFSFKQRQRNIHRNHDFSGLFVLHAIVSIQATTWLSGYILARNKKKCPEERYLLSCAWWWTKFLVYCKLDELPGGTPVITSLLRSSAKWHVSTSGMEKNLFKTSISSAAQNMASKFTFDEGFLSTSVWMYRYVPWNQEWYQNYDKLRER